MSLDEESVKKQLTDLFGKTDDFQKRMSSIEVMVENDKKTVLAINASTKQMEVWVKEAQIVLYGNKDLGVEGLVARNQAQDKKLSKIELIIIKVSIGIAVTGALLKYLGILDKIL